MNLITNIDEFMKVGQKLTDASWFTRTLAVLSAIAWFYIPRVLFYYVFIAGLLPFGAAAFTLGNLMRNRELIAMLAGGISLFRIALPMLLLTAATSLILFVDQEILIPNPTISSQLQMGNHDVSRGHKPPFTIYFAPDQNNALLSAGTFDTKNNTLKNIIIQQRDDSGIEIQRIIASQADWNPQKRGWELTNGYAVSHLTKPDIFLLSTQQPTSIDFISSDLDPTTIRLRQNARYRQLLSLRQLSQLMRKPEIIDTRDLKLIQQSRFSTLVMNILILAMGLPFYLLRTPGNLLQQTIKAIPLCMGAWAGGFIMLQIGPGTISPIAIAWLPVMIYFPVAFFLMDRVKT